MKNAKKCLKKYGISLGRVVEFENEWGVVKWSEFKVELSENGWEMEKTGEMSEEVEDEWDFFK